MELQQTYRANLSTALCVKKRKSNQPNEAVEKKLKVDGDTAATVETKVKVAADKVSTARCGTCRQLVDSPDTIRYKSHPQRAVEVFIIRMSVWLAL
jgi:hypothetical protein